ncbi:MAG: hypothetical protein ACC628_24090, partial [Pirellulaceae bacterium]
MAFTLDVVTADDTRLIDWEEAEPHMRPSGLDDAIWAERFPLLQEWFGPTWGDYVGRLSEAEQFWMWHGGNSNGKERTTNNTNNTNK